MGLSNNISIKRTYLRILKTIVEFAVFISIVDLLEVFCTENGISIQQWFRQFFYRIELPVLFSR